MNADEEQRNWSYPALFQATDSSCWYLVHEADVNRDYCATKLSNLNKKNSYKVTLPGAHEGEGEALPTISLPWKSPWRVIILGQLSDIVESTWWKMYPPHQSLKILTGSNRDSFHGTIGRITTAPGIIKQLRNLQI